MSDVVCGLMIASTDGAKASDKFRVVVGVLHPVQQPGSYWDRS